MSPAEAYIYAMQPFNNARRAPNDLTEADQWALGIGVARAKEQCELHKRDKFEGEDLLARGKLCILGLDFNWARQYLIAYIGLPQPQSPEVGRLLLARAFVGLQSISSAESQIESLLSLFPYDASIHLGIDMVIDAAAASDVTDDLDVIPRLNEQQLPHILDTLQHGGTVPPSNGDAVDLTLVVRDALRIADALRRNFKPDDADKIVATVKEDIAIPSITNSAAWPVLQNELTRYQLFDRPTPVRTMHGSELPMNGPPAEHTVLLYDPDPQAHMAVRHINSTTTATRMSDDRILVLVFSLAGPASSTALQQILQKLAADHITPALKVIAVTSFAANIGIDTPNGEVFTNLRNFRAALPAALPVYIVPNRDLEPFAIDTAPAAILFDGKGRILWLNTLSGSPGSIHQMLREIETPILSINPPSNSY